MTRWRRQVAGLAQEFGRAVELTRRNHLRLTGAGLQPVFTASAPGDRRVLSNIERDLKRHSKKATR